MRSICETQGEKDHRRRGDDAVFAQDRRSSRVADHFWTATCFRSSAWRLRKSRPMFDLHRVRSGRHRRVGDRRAFCVGTIAGGYLTDAIGRKKMFIIDLVAIALFSILSVFVAATPWELVAARFFIGVFVGADYPIATSLIAEFTPKKHRSVSRWAWCRRRGIWALPWPRWWAISSTACPTAGSGCSVSAVIPCVILLVGRHDIPESPLWLAKKGRKEEADEIVHTRVRRRRRARAR